MSGKKILLIEDEESLSSVVALNLKLEGYEVTSLMNGQAAIDYALKIDRYDLIILDVMLPGVSGWDICTTYKKISETPILFMSAKGTSADKIKGLKLGADDYLAKPFDLEELLLRVQILLQRYDTSDDLDAIINIGDYEVNLVNYEVKKDQNLVVSLTKREVELLQLFKTHEAEVLSREYILEQLWGDGVATTTRTIDNYILAFRKLFEADIKNPKYFQSVRGVGYKFNAPKTHVR